MPMLVAVNRYEDDFGDPERIIAPVREAAKAHRASAVVPVSAKLEAEIAELPPDEAASFRKELGLAEPALDRLIRATYELLRAGSEANAKRLGVMRTEGKTYPVKDGEILHVLFNV